MREVEKLAGRMLRGMTNPHQTPSKPAPQPVDALTPAEPVEWLDTVPAYRDESECDA